VDRVDINVPESVPGDNGRADELFAFGANAPEDTAPAAPTAPQETPKRPRGRPKKVKETPPMRGSSVQTENAVDQAPDPYDPARYRKSSGLHAARGVKKLLTVIPVRKPKKGEFVRVHPGEDFRMEATMLTDDTEGSRDDLYLVTPDMEDEVVGEPTACQKLLVTAITKQGNVFVWPLSIQAEGGRKSTWISSLHDGMKAAEKRWVRVCSNMGLGAYDIFEASAQWADPEWPDLTFREILRLAFRDRTVDSENHPLLKSLRGEV
jgi:hypothetical protein